MNKYEVHTWGGGRAYVVEAEDSARAKKIVCRILGRPLSAPLIGVKGMRARKIST